MNQIRNLIGCLTPDIRSVRLTSSHTHQLKGFTMTRSLRAIAADIEDNWPKVNFGARPYLDAMHQLDSINDAYGWDSADSIVRYFLGNASTFRGEKARAIKAELKALI